MQAGEVIWLLAGIGIGLTMAMSILGVVLVVDSRRLQRGLSLAGEDRAPRPVSVKAAPLPPTPPPATERRPRPMAAAALSPLPPPVTRGREAMAADAETVQPGTALVDGAMHDLAAEIARVQASEPVTVEVEVELEPAPAPMRVVTEPTLPAVAEAPAAPIVLKAPAPAAQAAVSPVPPPLVVTPVLEPAPRPVPPKVPPLPKVAPARKFAPALPPRNPPAKS